MLPPHQNASFFSTTLLIEREPFDFLNLYIPTNPFNALANNVVPAVVLFSVVVGVALIGVNDKAPLLDVLGVARRAVAKTTDFVMALTPVGVFAIAAVVAGTLDFDDIRRTAGLSGELRRDIAVAQPLGVTRAGCRVDSRFPIGRCSVEAVTRSLWRS
jgi:Na+/H+-dicarboxylate symporter